MGQGGRTSLQAGSPALPPTDHPKKKEKTLGSFQPKLMTKIEVISQKPSKN